MWKAVRHQAYRALYLMGKTPPPSADVKTALTAGDDQCDCLVTAGNQKVDCYPNCSVAACNLISDTKPGLIGTPLPLGSCKNI